MNCFYHPEREAVSRCSNCGKALCKECAGNGFQTFCDSCIQDMGNRSFDITDVNDEYILEYRHSFRITIIQGLIGAIIIGFIAFFLTVYPQKIDIALVRDFWPYFAGGAADGFFLPFGWKALNKWTDSWRTIVIMPLLILLALKFAASCIIGPFSFVYQLYKYIKSK